MWDLSSQPGTEPASPALEVQSPNHCTTREVPICGVFTMCQRHGYTVLCAEHISSHLILSNNLIREILLYLFYSEQRAVQRGWLTLPGSHSQDTDKLGFEPRFVDSEAHALNHWVRRLRDMAIKQVQRRTHHVGPKLLPLPPAFPIPANGTTLCPSSCLSQHPESFDPTPNHSPIYDAHKYL